MPLKLNVGLSRKVGEANYGSKGASVNLELELDSGLISEPERLQDRIRQLFRLAKASVDEELHGDGTPNSAPASNNGHSQAHAANGNGNGRRSGAVRRATQSQVRALWAIAERQQLDLRQSIRDQFGLNEPDDLSITQASQLIDELKGATNGHGRAPMITTAKPRAPADRAAGTAPTNRDYISFSAISLYQQCPLRYHFKYVAGLPEETVSASLVFGGSIHSAVERHFRELMEGNPAPDLDVLLAEYHNAWQARSVGTIQFGKDDDVDSLSLLAERMLSTFRQSEFARPGGTILGIEEELRGQLIPGSPDLLARIDLIVETADALVITDLKTARSRWSSEQAESSAEQLLLYSELVKDLSPGKKLRLQFAVITKAKTPLLDCHEVTWSARRIERTKQIVRQVWRAIEAGSFYPAPSPMQCPTCPFREPCRDWRG